MATIKSSGDILASIGTDLADNNAGLISAEDVRHNMEDSIASVNRIVCSGDLDNQYPLYNVVRISNKLADGEAPSVTKTHGDVVIESGIFFPNAPANPAKRQTEPWLGEEGINHNNLANLTAGDPHTQYYALNGARNLTANFKAGNHWINASGFDDIGFKFLDTGNGLHQNLIFIPNGECFFWIFRISKIIGHGKKLHPTIDFPGRQELLCSNQSKGLTKFRSDEVLTTVTPGYGQVCRSG